MITRKEILKFSNKYGVPATTIDKDYVLGHLVAGIFDNRYLKKRFIFKGGTCLKKCYFEDYRFSEDLDFTIIPPIDKRIINSNLKNIIQKITSQTDILFGKLIVDDVFFQDKLKGYELVIPFWGANHPKNKKPSFNQNLPKIKIDITLFEKVYSQPEIRELIHPYSDISSSKKILVYSIEEIFAEKMRSLLQRSYSAPKDYYDLWYLSKNVTDLDWKKIKVAFITKIRFKNIKFNSIEDFFENRKLESVKKEWNNSLKNHLKSLPNVIIVIEELKMTLNSIWSK